MQFCLITTIIRTVFLTKAGIHCEFDLHCDPADNEDRERVRDIWLESSKSLLNKGAYFSRPYGPWAEMMYSRPAITPKPYRK